MGFFKNKPTRALIIIMVALVLLGVIIAKTYYSRVNRFVDPRVKPARELYGKYNSLAQTGNYHSIFLLLDSVESVYSKYPHYKNSYETGVIWNNRAAAYLTMAIYKDSLPHLGGSVALNSLTRDSLLSLSEYSSLKSIDIYQSWDSIFQNKDDKSTKELIRPKFITGLKDYTTEDQEKFLEFRLKELDEAKLETKRRLSVAYTNLGLVFRHRSDYDTAAKYYTRALELWEDNLSAENNLNRLLGKPLRKRTIIQKLFPRDRKD